ncbi:hypothetical protein [Bosea sp. (in: a-proteobacteria)]|uniref:hypothetical protein n=1 Tax=Bosea sp. (in: a-proteobacteria) TaxID=1871050 RepID=UPI003B3A53B1
MQKPFIAFRMTCWVLAFAALGWAVLTLRHIPAPGLLGMAQAVRLGQTFDTETLHAMAAEEDQHICLGEEGNSKLLIEFALFDRLHLAGGRVSDEALSGLRDAARMRLRCSPTDALAWLALYVVAIRQEGLGPSALAALRAAYRNGPHEAWLQMLRLPAVLTAWNGLPQDLRDAARTDFADLLQAGLDGAVAGVIVRAPAARREALLETICPLNRARKLAIAWQITNLRAHVEHRCLVDPALPVFLR